MTTLNRPVPYSVLLYIAWKSLVSKKLRSLLTIFGITIGVGAVFFLLSFGLGLRDLVTQQILGNQSIRSVSIDTPNSKILQLNANTAKNIGSLAHVSQISSDFSFPGGVSYNSSQIQSIVYGIDVPYQTLVSLTVTEGRLMAKDDTNTALINESALKAMGITDEQSMIGKTIGVTVPLKDANATKDELDSNVKIIGVVDSGAGSEIFIPKFNFESLGVGTYSDLRLLIDTSDNVMQVRHQIESQGFQTTSPIDTIQQINDIFRIFNIVLVGFGMIGMIIAVLGMFNTLTISLLERTKEIGLMLALGARPRDMRRLFIIEATLLSVGGSIIGIIIAIIFAAIINFILYQFAHSRGVDQFFFVFAIPWWLIVGTIVFMVGIGLLVVYFPARRAQRIKPIDALRRE